MWLTKTSRTAAASLMLIAGSALANPFGESDEFVCALHKGHYCTSGDGCYDINLDEFNAPRFLHVDRDSGVITVVDDANRVDRIEHEEMNGNVLFLQGVRARRGWTMAIPVDGRMVLSAAADGESISVFGTCSMELDY